MTRMLILAVWLVSLTASASANNLIPTLEDAGYAYEATETCAGLSTTFEATRRLRRQSRFKNGRKTFKNAAKQWGAEWACQTALQNLGSEVDLSDYASGKLVRQPPPSEIPPLPAYKGDIIGDLAAQ